VSPATERVVAHIRAHGPQRGRHIADALGMTLRAVGLAVREARLAGTPICSDSSRGYYLGDVSHTIADLKSRIRALAIVMHALDAATASRVQLALNLDGQP
jgi:biotin operon repressor